MRSGKDLSEKITFELRSEEKELYKYVGQKAFQREGRASAKALRQKPTWAYSKANRGERGRKEEDEV
jgi:hypothetical protein